MSVVLALDYGERRIGLAVTDPEQRTALAYGVVAAQPREESLAGIRRVIAAESVESIVVGLPLTLEGREGSQAEKARAFGKALAETTRLPVEFFDERFTSGTAFEAAKEKGTAEDAEAARLILEGWLAKRVV